MDFSLLLRGAVIGLSIAAPVGPIGLLCINRSLNKGKLHGFISGLGAASADALYGSIASFGLTIVIQFLVSQEIWFKLIGGLFLIYLGLRTFNNNTPSDNIKADSNSLLSDYFSVFLLTLSNPLTIIFFIAIFSALGASTGGNNLSALILVLGVFLGSGLWWLLLSQLAGYFKDKLSHGNTKSLNIISGLIIIGFGICSVYSII